MAFVGSIPRKIESTAAFGMNVGAGGLTSFAEDGRANCRREQLERPYVLGRRGRVPPQDIRARDQRNDPRVQART
jgi:hypothetical protein